MLARRPEKEEAPTHGMDISEGEARRDSDGGCLYTSTELAHRPPASSLSMSLSEQLRWDGEPTDNGGGGGTGGPPDGADWRYPRGEDAPGEVAAVVVEAVVNVRVDDAPVICRREWVGRSGGLWPPTLLPPPALALDSRRLREETFAKSPGSPSSEAGPQGGEPATAAVAPPARRATHTHAACVGGDAALYDGGRLTDPTRPSLARLTQTGDAHGRQPAREPTAMGDAEGTASSGSSDDTNVAAASASVDDDDAVSVAAPPSAK